MTVAALELTGLVRIRQHFVAAQCNRHDELEMLLAALKTGFEPEASLIAIRSILHKITGTAGTLGFETLGELAGHGERQIDALVDSRSRDFGDIIALLDYFLELSLDIIEQPA